MRGLVASLFVMTLMAGVADGQSGGDGEKALKEAVLKQQRFLRGYSADPQVHWRWNGNVLAEDAPIVHTLGVLTAKSVKVKNDSVEIRGTRQTWVTQKGKAPGLSESRQDVTIFVDLKGADMAAMLPKLADLLFFANSEEAIAGLPSLYRSAFDTKYGSGSEASVALKACDCASPSEATCGVSVPAPGMSGMKPPAVIKMVDPEFSEDARRAKFNGSVEVGVDVETSGQPTNLWIMKPAGMGLSEQAAKAVSQYVFKPATCHGHAVRTTLSIGVNFQIF